MELVLNAVDRERHHRDRDGNGQTADRGLAAPPQAIARDRKHGCVGDRRRDQALAAHLREGQRREQPHGAEYDEGARIPEKMREIEARRGCRLRSGLAGREEGEQALERGLVEAARHAGGSQVIDGEAHGSAPGEAFRLTRPAATGMCIAAPIRPAFARPSRRDERPRSLDRRHGTRTPSFRVLQGEVRVLCQCDLVRQLE